jgi:hypothetical protein
MPYSFPYCLAAGLLLAACTPKPTQPAALAPCQIGTLPSSPFQLPAVSRQFRQEVLADNPKQSLHDRPAWWARALDTTNVAGDCARRFDFEPLWRKRNGHQLGFVGPGYTRLRLHFDFLLRDCVDPTLYWVRGQCQADSLIIPLQGYFRITHARQRRYAPARRLHCDDTVLTQSRGLVLGEYHLAQHPRSTAPVELQGVFLTNWLADEKGRLRYDDDEYCVGDFFNNNSFVGAWQQGAVNMACHWGDYHIYGDRERNLDIGASWFYPDIETYKNVGWESYANTITQYSMEGDTLKYVHALWDETEWWLQ